MSKKQPKSEQPEKEPRRTTPTFLLELPLVVHEGQAKRLRAHLEAGRQFYNAVLSAGQKRLRRMRTDPAWQEARALPRTQKRERNDTGLRFVLQKPKHPVGHDTAGQATPALEDEQAL